MKKLNARHVIVLGLLIAMEVVFSRFLSISTPIVRISCTFLPVAITAICYGPAWSATCAALADIIGMMLFPVGAYFPGFTLTAALTGAVYGFLLYRHPNKFWRVAVAVVIINIFLNLGLDTYWISIVLEKSAIALLPVRAVKCLVMIPMQILVVQLTQRYIRLPRLVYDQDF
ncbi:MAG TPA: folate family ECF transporter S component [Clostridia bacterium]|nr:folate family ECF transporter S component [Clostridia bacterium]